MEREKMSITGQNTLVITTTMPENEISEKRRKMMIDTMSKFNIPVFFDHGIIGGGGYIHIQHRIMKNRMEQFVFLFDVCSKRPTKTVPPAPLALPSSCPLPLTSLFRNSDSASSVTLLLLMSKATMLLVACIALDALHSHSSSINRELLYLEEDKSWPAAELADFRGQAGQSRTGRRTVTQNRRPGGTTTASNSAARCFFAG